MRASRPGTAILAMIAAAVLGCRSVPQPTPLDQLNAQQARGHAIFQAKCSVCHYDRRDGPLHGPSLLGVFKKQELPSGAAATDEQVESTIVHGRNMMPAMGNTMDPQDMDDLMAYLHTL
jgi:mono/diheme cytochrome c family protein